MKPIIILILICFTFNWGICGNYPQSSVGIGYNMISGSGISYQFDFDRENSIILNGFYYYYDKNPPDESSNYLIYGGEYHYSLDKTIDGNFYAFIGGSFWKLEEKYITSYTINDKKYITKHIDRNLISNYGIGFGYEYLVENSVFVDFNLGVYNQNSGNLNIASFIDRNPIGSNFKGLGAGIGIRILIR